ncbi:hypothetical protein GN316_01695 [Xylophilus sp. Kf1]|nr:hypothetical protein [Xylophilus sp. Kf1]
MSDRKPFSGTIEIEGGSYPFRGSYKRMETEPRGVRFGWNAEVDGLGLLPADRELALPSGYPGINDRMVTIFVQDYFQGLVRLRVLQEPGT